MKVTRFTFNPFSENTYILWDAESREAAIIDPGMINADEQKQIDNFIKNNELKLTHLINTHLHIDHSFGVKYISGKYDLQLKGNKDDNFLGKNLPMQAEMFGLPYKIEEVEIEHPLKEGDTLKIGNEELKILQVPGHSPGNIVLHAPESNFIIAGDVLFEQSIGRTDLPGGNHNQLIEGIKSKLFSLPDNTTVYPGHGDATTIGDEKHYNPYIG